MVQHAAALRRGAAGAADRLPGRPPGDQRAAAAAVGRRHLRPAAGAARRHQSGPARAQRRGHRAAAADPAVRALVLRRVRHPRGLARRLGRRRGAGRADRVRAVADHPGGAARVCWARSCSGVRPARSAGSASPSACRCSCSLPWWPSIIAAPGRLFVGPDAALGGAPAAPAVWGLLLGRGLGPGLPPLWLGAVIFGVIWLVALIGLARRPDRRAVVVGLDHGPGRAGHGRRAVPAGRRGPAGGHRGPAVGGQLPADRVCGAAGRWRDRRRRTGRRRCASAASAGCSRSPCWPRWPSAWSAWAAPSGGCWPAPPGRSTGPGSTRSRRTC